MHKYSRVAEAAKPPHYSAAVDPLMPPRNPPNPRASAGAENAIALRPRAAAAIHDFGASIIAISTFYGMTSPYR